jgi:PAS domain S-box-containing protein
MTPPELSPQALSVVLESLLEGIACARRGRITFVNAAFAELVGRDAGELNGTAIEDVIEVPATEAGDAPEGVFEAVLKRPDGERPAVRAERLLAQGGQSIWILSSVSTPRGMDEATERLEAALRRIEEEKLELEERLHREVSDRDDMVGLMSHELRTPVTVISGYSKLLLSEEVGALNEVQRTFMDATAKSCQRLSNLIGTLLEAAAQATGEVQLEATDGPIAPTLQDVVGLIKPPRGESRPLRRLPHRAGPHQPAGERHPLRTPALDHSGGQPYVRAGEPRAGGLGLGLAICRRLVEAHGGVMALREAPDGGACFAFTLALPVSGEQVR